MKNIIPQPKKLSSSDTLVTVSRIAECGLSVKTECTGEVALSAVERLTKAITSATAALPPFEGSYPIILTIDPTDPRISQHGTEAYALTVTEKSTTLTAASDRALYYAAVTLSGLFEKRADKICLPVCEIIDYPDYKTRGMFAENRYNDFSTLDDWKLTVDTLADLKMNTLKVGLYGTWSMQYDRRLTQHAYIPYKSHPEIRSLKNEKYFSPEKGGWVNKPDRLPLMYEQDFFGDIVAYGKTKGVEVIPLINSLGHNSLIPEVIPEISAKDENGNVTGYGLCTANPKTYEVFFELYDEIIDRYLKPNGITSFHIGLDEVGNSRGVDKNDIYKNFNAHCMCEKCRDIPVQTRMIDYMIKLIKHLKSRGMKNIYVYYDMFFYVYGMMNEQLADILHREGVYDDTVMVWWNYGASVDFFRGKYKELNGLFRSVIKPMSGYFGWTGLTDNLENMAECSYIGNVHGFEGVVSYANFDPRFEYNHAFLGECSWNAVTDKETDIARFRRRFFENKYPDYPAEAEAAYLLAQHRLHPYNYTEKPPTNIGLNQYTYSYLSADDEYPREHFRHLINKIESNPDFYLNYIEDFDRRVKEAVAFFTSDKAEPSVFNKRLVIDLEALTISNTELASLYRFYKASKEGTLVNSEFITELELLIRRRKRMMLGYEEIFMPALVSQPLRIATICLEYLEELIEAVRTAEREGRVFTYDLLAVIDRTAPIYTFLR